MSSIRPDTLVLDFGGVISRTLFETHDLTERALGLPPGTLDWRGPFAPQEDALWAAMQRDEITERDYWGLRTKEVGALIGKEWTRMDEFVRAARGAEPEEIIRPEFFDTLARVKKAGLTTAILSNELDLFYGEDFRDKLPFLTRFDLIIDATYTKILKPDQRAYSAITNGLKITPQQCVFVDDQNRNIKGAKLAGWHTVLFDVHHPARSYSAALSLLDLEPLTATTA